LVGLIFQKRFNSRHFFFAKRDMYYMCDIHFNCFCSSHRSANCYSSIANK